MISVVDISKSFDGRSVLKNVSIDVMSGETLAVIGRSGSGKSVLMKHMIGLLKPDHGQVLIDEVDINKVSYSELRSIRQQFGVLFQGGALFDSMTAFDNVAFPLRTFTRLGPGEVRDRVDECLEMVRLTDIGTKVPAELSGGMQKRVALARAIALKPAYIFYDEPTSGLDPQTSNTINDLINDLADRLDITSVVITHDMHSVLEIADRAAFIHAGTIWWSGTLAELHACDDPEVRSFVKASEYKIGEDARPRVTIGT